MRLDADVLFENARVFTADPVRPWAKAAAVRGKHILWVGGAAEAREYRSGAERVIDAGGALLLPGFIDSHFHLMYGAQNLDGMLFGDVTDYEQMAVLIHAYAAAHPNDPWLHGTGLRYHTGPGSTPLDRRILDALVPDRPLYINAYDGHTSWANTRALQLAGIFHGAQTGPNSEIVLDERGEATGELREPGAYLPVSRLVPKPDEPRRRSLLRQALSMTAGLGITSVHNMDGDSAQAELYARMEDQGELTCRIYMPFTYHPETPLAALEREAMRMRREFTGEFVRAGAVKFFMDGVVENYTALLDAPYADDPSTCGAANYPFEAFQRAVLEADRLGLQVHTHAIGDLGVRRVLDACEAAGRINGNRDARHRVEHIELVAGADLPRFRQLGVIASMQPLHAPSSIEEGDIWLARVGAERWPFSFAWQSLRQAGARLIFGSDWPVVTQDPLRGLWHAVNRRPWAAGLPEQRQQLAEALLSYTREAAYAEFQEDRKGQIRSGMLADLVLLTHDLFALPPAELNQARVRLTMVGGRVVYEG